MKLFGFLQSPGNGLKDLFARKPLFCAENGGHADGEIADIFGGGILGQLEGDPFQRFLRLEE